MPLLECKDLCLGYPTSQGWKAVVHDVSFHIQPGETVALVGESGSGKSTIAKCLVKLIPIKGGQVRFKNKNITDHSAKSFHPYRKKIQLVFQDPWQALNPRLSASQLIAEPLDLHFSHTNTQRKVRIDELLDSVHLPKTISERYPSELSGGQRQRLLLARALAVELTSDDAKMADKPVSKAKFSGKLKVEPKVAPKIAAKPKAAPKKDDGKAKAEAAAKAKAEADAKAKAAADAKAKAEAEAKAKAEAEAEAKAKAEAEATAKAEAEAKAKAAAAAPATPVAIIGIVIASSPERTSNPFGLF